MEEHELHRKVIQWIREVHGNKRESDSIMIGLQVRVDDFILTYDAYRGHGGVDATEEFLHDYAVIQIKLWNLMDSLGFCSNKLNDAILMKHLSNKKRHEGKKDF